MIVTYPKPAFDVSKWRMGHLAQDSTVQFLVCLNAPRVLRVRIYKLIALNSAAKRAAYERDSKSNARRGNDRKVAVK